jgi:hypothetical protein
MSPYWKQKLVSQVCSNSLYPTNEFPHHASSIRVSISCRGRNLYLLHSVHTGSRTTHVSYPLCTRDRMARAWTWPVTPSSANVQKIWNYRLCPFLNTSVSSWWAKQATMKYRDNFMSYFTVTWVVTHRILTMQTQGTQFDLQCLKLDWGWLLCSIFILLVPPAITISYLPTIPSWTNLLVIHPIVL